MKKFVVCLAVAVMMAAAPMVLAEEAGDAKAEGIAVTIVGTNYNLLQTLAADQVAEAPSEIAGINALKITSCTDAEGAAHEALAGKTVHYLPNAAAKDLVVGAANAGKTVTVKGTLFADENAVLVDSFEAAADDGDDWDELDLGTLSGQQVL